MCIYIYDIKAPSFFEPHCVSADLAIHGLARMGRHLYKRGRMRFTLPTALLNGLLTTVQTTISNTLTTAQGDVDALVGTAVAALPSGFLTSTELVQVESWTQTEIASSITGVTGNVVTIVSNAGDAVQACPADFMFSPAIPALLANMTNAVLSELPAALRQVLSGRSQHPMCIAHIIYLRRKQGRRINHINGRCFQSTKRPCLSQHLPTTPRRR